tara:strand:+ start:4340 stop:4669 length:330 start_codon:yes stop_codon:yes gene_type:complete
MDLTYIWEIVDMKRNASDGGVFEVTYHVWARDKEDKRYWSIRRTVGFTPSAPFKKYEDLTQEEVLKWVQDAVNKTEMEELVKQEWIKMFPSAAGVSPVVAQGTPWGGVS